MFGTKTGPKTVFYFILGIALFSLFQNCSGVGYRTIDGVSGDSDQASSLASLDPSVPSRSLSGTEWKPLKVMLTASHALAPTALPSGAYFDSTTNSLYWLPQIGQAGTYAIPLKYVSNGQSAYGLSITINPLDSATVARGPVDGAQDGDVGYVFIHGMGIENYCASSSDLSNYWSGAPSAIVRDASSSTSTLACYDSTQSVESVALSVAQQILSANCGTYKKCILITHSMGGLIAEHILTHARAAISSDPEPALFDNWRTYAQVKARTLSVVSIASAAGGALAASTLENPTFGAVSVVALLANQLNFNSAAAHSLVIDRAAGVLAPLTADPGVPVYLIAGYTNQTTYAAGLDLSHVLLNAPPGPVFNGSSKYASMDAVMQWSSLSDGIVEFRSSCGIASDDPEDGPGYTAANEAHFAYCYTAKKKPRHYVWFLTNANHSLNATSSTSCGTSNTCTILEPDEARQTFTANSALQGQSAVQVIRSKLDGNRTAMGSAPVIVINTSN